MNTIYPVSPINFLGARQTATRKATQAQSYLCKHGYEERLYEQSPKMQELVGQIFRYFEERGKKADEAIQALREKFPEFSIQINRNPIMHGENFELRTNRETLYEMKENRLHQVRDIDTYTIKTRAKLKPLTFMCTVTSPESGTSLYSVPDFFNKTNLDGKPDGKTRRNVEESLKAVVKGLKKEP